MTDMIGNRPQTADPSDGVDAVLPRAYAAMVEELQRVGGVARIDNQGVMHSIVRDDVGSARLAGHAIDWLHLVAWGMIEQGPGPHGTTVQLTATARGAERE